MNNQQPAYSGNRLSFIQLFTKNELRVEIPIIQRDYAQGRENEHEVRDAFLEAIYNYLDEGKPFRDLDFVYGSILKEDTKGLGQVKNHRLRFVPLDGQQRLTTLFLLHWYLAQTSGKTEELRSVLSNGEMSLFSYETRNSSREFCDALMLNDINLTNLLKTKVGEDSVAQTIKDKSWYFSSWGNDPTISAMLTMLDAIHLKFSGRNDFFDKLVDKESPVITFLFLNLKEFQLTDDLYIKMNARGKPLSDFENFKARLEKKIKSFQEPWPEYKLSFKEGLVSGYEYFIHKIDNDWADIFWTYRNVSSKDDTYDDELMNFIALFIANHHVLSSNPKANNFFKQRDRLFGGGQGKLQRISFLEYEQIGCITQEFAINLIQTLDLLSDAVQNSKTVSHYIKHDFYYSEVESFKGVIKNETSYQEKLRFYSFYLCLAKGYRHEQLVEWMRVIFNLTENRVFNNVGEYCNALVSVQEFVLAGESILQLLIKDVDIQGFTKEQVLEEKVKAHLISKGSDWCNAIIEIEKHPYFIGQIGFLLKFSGILDYYNQNKNTNWGDLDEQYFQKFNHYAHLASAVFSKINKGSRSINYVWERAVLTKGEYFIATPRGDRFNLLSSSMKENNIERDYSWKRLLREQGRNWGVKQEYVKEVLDDPDFLENDVQGSLENICDKFLSQVEDDDWRRMLVKFPNLYKICHQGFILKNDQEIVLFHQSQRNHYHSELYSKFLEQEFMSNAISIEPFNKFEYEDVKSGDDYSQIIISGFDYGTSECVINIWYVSNQYVLFFYDDNNKPFPKNIVDIIVTFGLTPNKEFEDFEEAYSYTCSSELEFFDKFYYLMGELKSLVCK